MFLQPVKIFTSSRCIYDQQKFFVVDPVNDQIINDSTMFVKEESVLALPDLELVDIICEHEVEPCASSASLGNQLSHLRHIEYVGILAQRVRFLALACLVHAHERA